MKYRLVAALAAGVVAVGVGIGSSMALFSSRTVESEAQFTAGTLTLSSNRDMHDTVPGPMFYLGPGEGKYPTGEWAPGDSAHRVLQVRNTGSLAGVLTSIGATLQSGSSDLTNVLEVKVTSDPAGNNILAQGTLADFLSGAKPISPIDIQPFPASLISLHFWVTLPLSADNTYQAQTTVVTFFVNAEQKAHNP